jgi:hypothetical protein
MSKTTSMTIAVVLAALALYLLSLVFWTRFKHEDFSGECSQGGDLAKVELVGTLPGFAVERGAPYFLRLQVFDGGKMRLAHPVLVEATSRHPVRLQHLKRTELEGANLGDVFTVWYAPDLEVDYVDHNFEATLISPAGETRKLACILKPHPTVEWTSPIWEALTMQ